VEKHKRIPRKGQGEKSLNKIGKNRDWGVFFQSCPKVKGSNY